MGLHNLIFLIMIVAAVILSGTLPGMAAFQDAEGAVRGIHLFGEVTLTYPALIEAVIILAAAWLSFSGQPVRKSAERTTLHGEQSTRLRYCFCGNFSSPCSRPL
mgnify:CR=1 FL=1